MLYVARRPMVAAWETGVWTRNGAKNHCKFLMAMFGIKDKEGVRLSRIPWGIPRMQFDSIFDTSDIPIPENCSQC